MPDELQVDLSNLRQLYYLSPIISLPFIDFQASIRFYISFRKKINFMKTTAVLYLKYDVIKTVSMRLLA